MKRIGLLLILVAIGLWFTAPQAPAPLIYRPGVGWIYVRPGTKETWRRDRAKDQLEVAKDAFQARQYKLALRAALRTVETWPLSDYAPEAQYLVGRCYEALRRYEKAFNAYQKLIDKYPKFPRYDEVIKRQFEIACRFLAGQRFRLWGLFPLYRSMNKTAEMYVKVIANAPQSPIAPLAQLCIGIAREKQKDYMLAAHAYEKLIEKYPNNKLYAAEGMFREAMAWYKQSLAAEYDQSAAQKAIDRFNDFTIMFPDDVRVEKARQIVLQLRTEQARGAFEIARFYEKRRKWVAARIYYNEVLVKAPDSEYAKRARERLAALQSKLQSSSQPPSQKTAQK